MPTRQCALARLPPGAAGRTSTSPSIRRVSQARAFGMQTSTLLFATLVIHYWANAGFVGDLLGGVGAISHIPAVLIHGRLDVSSPLRTAWDLHRAWPASTLMILEDEGHGGASMGDEIRRAIAMFGVSV